MLKPSMIAISLVTAFTVGCTTVAPAPYDSKAAFDKCVEGEVAKMKSVWVKDHGNEDQYLTEEALKGKSLEERRKMIAAEQQQSREYAARIDARWQVSEKTCNVQRQVLHSPRSIIAASP